MAGALIGGALLSASLQTIVDRLASRQVVNFFFGIKLDEGLLEELKLKLLSIDTLAVDAELKQLRDPHVRKWLFAVKDVVFDAEDLLAEIDYEFTKCQVEAESVSQTFTHKVSKLSNLVKVRLFNKKIVSEMKQVLGRLESLASQKVNLGLKGATHSSVGSGSKVSGKSQSSSLVAESVIYGRDEDKTVIFSWLTSETNNRNQLSIFSIVGMGGLGKTTLAQHIYNDPRMEEAKFDIKAWVCISDDFDVLKVSKAILEAITKSRDDSGSLEMVHGRLKEKLSGKRFLLVLDDVWNQNQQKWEDVLTPLNYGACGSKILVTTRITNVASIMHSNEVHHLKQLHEDQCWNVFAKHAFQDDYPPLSAEWKEIATKIVKKCKGLPLALKSIGSLLYTKSSLSEWESVLLSEIWDSQEEDNEIIPALFLSYHYLPSHLKRCFAFCALFPKDHEFDKEALILLWMAENLLQCPRQSKSPEEVGKIYFDELLSRSFFQQLSREKMDDPLSSRSIFQQLSREKKQSSKSKTYFVMHDLLNDLAKYVCGEICFRSGVDKAEGIPKTTRYFSFNIYNVYCDDIGSLSNAKRLRTFIPTNKMNDDMCWSSEIQIHELCSKFKFLHTVSLSHCDNLVEVPESIDELKYLCSLDLSRTSIKRLPSSTCSLYNLHILKLNFCKSLEELPSDLHKLANLRYLEFRGSRVRRMPMHFKKLKNLQVLSTFCVGESSELSLEQLRGLNLHGELSIKELQNTVNPTDALAVDLKNKTHLVKLALKWNSNHIPDDPRKDREILENLQPSKYLKDLSIVNYGGTQFPSWLLDNSFSNVVSLLLKECKYCFFLPPFGNLPFLKELRIKGLDGIVKIGAEFYGSSSSPFPSLETLEFYDMKEWEEWECENAFPRLQLLDIKECRKLKCMSEQLLHVSNLRINLCGSTEASSFEWNGHAVSNTCLEDLYFNYCPNMYIPNRCCYDSLVELRIYGSCDSLTTFLLDLFPKLSLLHLRNCDNLRMITQEHTHNHLKDLRIDSCPQFESFPNEGLFAPRLASFVITELENLKSLPKSMHILLPSLTDLILYDCPQVEMFSEGGLPSNLKMVNLSVSSLKLIASLKGALGANTCLLRIEKLDDVECFPEEGLLPLSLTHLDISYFPNLNKLDYKGLCNLSSLDTLILWNCPNLECLPEEGLPKSISSLTIRYCPLLQQRCQKPEGQDWGKIAHIQDLDIESI